MQISTNKFTTSHLISCHPAHLTTSPGRWRPVVFKPKPSTYYLVKCTRISEWNSQYIYVYGYIGVRIGVGVKRFLFVSSYVPKCLISFRKVYGYSPRSMCAGLGRAAMYKMFTIAKGPPLAAYSWWLCVFVARKASQFFLLIWLLFIRFSIFQSICLESTFFFISFLHVWLSLIIFGVLKRRNERNVYERTKTEWK